MDKQTQKWMAKELGGTTKVAGVELDEGEEVMVSVPEDSIFNILQLLSNLP